MRQFLRNAAGITNQAYTVPCQGSVNYLFSTLTHSTCNTNCFQHCLRTTHTWLMQANEITAL